MSQAVDSSTVHESVEYVLSPLQEGMLFQWRVDSGAGTDIEQIVAELNEEVDIDRLGRAWQNAVDTFGTLRTAFRWDGLERPLQRIESAASIPFAWEDLTAVSRDEAERRIAAFLKADRLEGFDLSRAPAMRVHVFKLSVAQFRMVWTVHHILIDGRSFEVILNDVFGTYDGVAVAHVERPYREYVEWTEQQDHAPAREFWRAKLDGFTAPTALPFDFPIKAGHEDSRETRAQLSVEVTANLRALAEREGLTLNTLVMSAWGLMLSRYAGETDIVFGATKTTRRGTIPDADSVTGVFLATVPVRLRANPQQTVLEWMHHVRDEWVSLRGHEHLPLVEMRKASSVTTPRLFDALYVYEHHQFGTRLQAQGGAWANRSVDILEQTGFPLALAAYGEDTLALRIEFDAVRFRASTIDAMVGHLCSLLTRWSANFEGLLWESSMLSSEEYENVTQLWNRSTTDYPRDSFIHEIIEAHATRDGEAIAIREAGVSMTYRDLNQRSSTLADYLSALGVKPLDRVGIYLERSSDFIVAMLAVLKTGAAYVPLEPNYPKDRLLFMAEDAGLAAVVTARAFHPRLKADFASLPAQPIAICVDEERAPSDQACGYRDHVMNADPGNAAAYVMYTSGSTGKPKGVAVPHRGIVRMAINGSWLPFTPSDRMLAAATIMFDGSAWEIWTALLCGGRVVLSPPGPVDLAVIGALIEAEGVTTLFHTPAMFQEVVALGMQPYKCVRTFLLSGDVAPVRELQRARELLPDCTFINGYGPTENSVISCAYTVPASGVLDDPLPIGVPVGNSTMYVLDSHGLPTAVGVTGELYTGGDGVGLGYINRPELTNERFLPDPFARVEGARMYRTGDGARWRADGQMVFVGRLDNQVKIRGHRIEPGEVESLMNGLPGVRAAAVVARPDQFGQKRLVGYFVADDLQNVSGASVRAELREQLPDYMVPSIVMRVETMPLNSSGKIDRLKLPEPSSEISPADDRQYARPVSRSQRHLAQIWERLLDHRPIGIDDDFFDIGGHSLLAVKMMAELEKAVGRSLPLAMLLEHSTIRKIAQRLDRAILDEPEPLTTVLQADGSDRPFAYVHGDLTGGGWYCRRLASIISPDIPMIVLPTLRPDMAGEATTIEAIAHRHLQELQKIQPKGPYRLGGFCAGGWIALEMARCLKAAGETVERVVLIDSVLPNAPSARWRALIDRKEPPSTARDQMDRRIALIRRFRYYDERLQVVKSLQPLDLARWALNAVRVKLGGNSSRDAVSGVSSNPESATPSRSKPVIRPEREKLNFYSRAGSAYLPRSYEGHVDLVFSSDPLDQLINPTEPVVPGAKPELGTARIERAWKRVLKNADVHHVPGSHIGIIVENLADLGACLRKCLGVPTSR